MTKKPPKGSYFGWSSLFKKAKLRIRINIRFWDKVGMNEGQITVGYFAFIFDYYQFPLSIILIMMKSR